MRHHVEIAKLLRMFLTPNLLASVITLFSSSLGSPGLRSEPEMYRGYGASHEYIARYVTYLAGPDSYYVPGQSVLSTAEWSSINKKACMSGVAYRLLYLHHRRQSPDDDKTGQAHRGGQNGPGFKPVGHREPQITRHYPETGIIDVRQTESTKAG